MYYIYGKPDCPNCTKAKQLLNMKHKDFVYIDVTQDDVSRKAVIATGKRQLPQVYRDAPIGVGVYVGTYQGLVADILK